MDGSLNLGQFIFAVSTAAISTFLGSFVLDSLKLARRLRADKNAFSAQLALELQQLVRLIERLKIEEKAVGYFPKRFTDIAAGQLNRIENYIHQASSLLSNTEMIRRLFESITESRVLVTEIDQLENWAYSGKLTDDELKEVREQRTEKNIELSDTLRRLDDITKELSR